MSDRDSSPEPQDDFLPETADSDLTNQPETSTTFLPPTGNTLAQFLENLYGSLFTPEATFRYLRSHPSVLSGVGIVALVNTLEALRIGNSISTIPLSIIPGLIGWLVFALLLRALAAVFNKSVELPVLLTLTAFGSTPWLFMGPALSFGGSLGTLAALVVMIWFSLWQLWAASVAIAIDRWQLLSLIPLTISGGFVALIWSGNVLKLLFSLSR